MNSGFSHTFAEQRPSFLSRSGLQYGTVPPSGHPEYCRHPPHMHPGGDSLAHTVPLLLYPAKVDSAFYKNSYPCGPPFIPYLPTFHGHFGVYECPFEPAFIQKRNERERQRVKCVNQGYAKLREHLPGGTGDKRLSKVETLRAAIRYIKQLQELVTQQPREPTCKNASCRALGQLEAGHSDGESGSSSPGLYGEESEGTGS